MKTSLKIIMVAGVVGVFMASSASGGIENSDHDFSGSVWSGGQICLPCHAPHNNDNNIGELLWNHEITSATFSIYSSLTMDALTGDPTGVSKFCLSCHDGTVAIDSFGGSTGGTMIAGDENLGSNLSDDHPISFVYDTVLAVTDAELADPDIDSSNMPGGGTIAADMLYGGELHCSSCHDVHNAYNNSYLLNVDNDGSALCLTCHLK